MTEENSPSAKEAAPIQYQRTTVPSSMRSPYWKHFGFPSDGANNIITREKIVCNICNAIISYNRNTSNLRTHLLARHSEVLHHLQQQYREQQLQNQEAKMKNHQSRGSITNHNINSGGLYNLLDATALIASTSLSSKRSSGDIIELDVPQPPIKRLTPSTLASNSNRSSTITYTIRGCPDSGLITDTGESEGESGGIVTPLNRNNAGHDHIIQELIQDEPMKYTVSELRNDQQIDSHREPIYETQEVVTIGEISDEDEEEREEINGVVIEDYEAYVEADPQDDAMDACSKPIECGDPLPPYDQAMADILVQDLLPMYTLNGEGFRRIINATACDGGGSYEPKAVIERIATLYRCMQDTIGSELQRLSHEGPYSISVEVYRNIENIIILNVYYNYFSVRENDLCSVLYHTERYGGAGSVNFPKIFNNFNIDLCAAIIVNDDMAHEAINQFAGMHGINVIDCIDAILTRCMENVFACPCIEDAFEGVCKLAQGINTLPELNANCPWSKLNYLQYVVENLEWNAARDVGEFLNCLRPLVKYLAPLKISLETMAAEPLPLATLIRPMILKLFQQHFPSFRIVREQNDYLNAAWQVVEQYLYQRTLKNKFLKVVTFFDARFHHEFIDNAGVKLSCGSNAHGPTDDYNDRSVNGDDDDDEENSTNNRLVIQKAIRTRFENVIQRTMCAQENRKPITATATTSQIETLDKSRPMSSSAVGLAKPQSKPSPPSPFNGNNHRRSTGLKWFFCSLNEAQQQNGNADPSLATPSRLNIETEFMEYRRMPVLDLDHCPIKWWQSHAGKYQLLSKISDYYLCVPCCASRLALRPLNSDNYNNNDNNNDDEDEDKIVTIDRINWLNKRYMLRYHCFAERYLWYMHYNQSFYNGLIGRSSP